MLLPTLFYFAVTYLSFVSTCVDSLSLLSAPWACWARVNCYFSLSTATWTLNFWPFWSLGSAKTLQWKWPFSHILCSFLCAIRQYIERLERSRWSKMFQILLQEFDPKFWSILGTRWLCPFIHQHDLEMFDPRMFFSCKHFAKQGSSHIHKKQLQCIIFYNNVHFNLSN